VVCLDGHAAGDAAARRARSPWYRHKRTPSRLDMLVAFRRAMLTEYHHAHPAQPTRHKTHRRTADLGPDLGPYRRVNTPRCETQAGWLVSYRYAMLIHAWGSCPSDRR
jgi:hypothetical protein